MLDKIVPDVTPKESSMIEAVCKKGTAPRGTVLIGEGSLERDLFFLMDGKVKIYQLAVLAGQTCALEIAEIEAPIVLGEANLFRAEERAATVLITKETHYLQLPYSEVEKLKITNPNIIIKLLEYSGAVVSQRLVNHQIKIHSRLVAEANDIRHALLNLNRYVGDVKICPNELARKLFNIAQPKDAE